MIKGVLGTKTRTPRPLKMHRGPSADAIVKSTVEKGGGLWRLFWIFGSVLRRDSFFSDFSCFRGWLSVKACVRSGAH